LKLFDDFSRRDSNRADYLEPRFNYLNRTARPPFNRIRELLQGWHEKYPEFAVPVWTGRFRSNDDPHHIGAFHELFIRALLDHQRFDIEREPEGTGSKRVEFLARNDQGPVFVMECVLAAGPSFNGADKRRVRRAFDEIDKLESGSFFVDVDVASIGDRDLSGRDVKRWLRTKMSLWDPDAVTASYRKHGWQELPQVTWTGDGWHLRFRLIPKKESARGKAGHRIIGLMSDSTREVTIPLDTRGPLLNALKRKASRYGRPGMPYVIAVDGLDDFVDQESMVGALFGAQLVVWNLPAGDTSLKRAGDGFWSGRTRPLHKRVSAVLFSPNLYPHTIGSSEPVLYHNPCADYPMAPELWQLKQMVVNRGSSTLVERDGKSLRDLLDLEASWPGWAGDIDAASIDCANSPCLTQQQTPGRA
jgi:hypothetical protein